MIVDLDLTMGLAAYFKQQEFSLPVESNFNSKRKYQYGIRSEITVQKEDNFGSLIEGLYRGLNLLVRENTPPEASKVIFNPPFLYTYVAQPNLIKRLCRDLNFPIMVFRYADISIDTGLKRDIVSARSKIYFDKGTSRAIKKQNSPVNLTNE